MDDTHRKGITFDLDTKALKENYTKSDWHNAYYDIRKYLEKEGFESISGSTYHLINPMPEARVLEIILELRQEHPWTMESVRVCTISDIPITTDVTHLFS